MSSATPPSFIHSGQVDRPDWMKPYLVGKTEPNGTFLVRTRYGQSRVHRGQLVMLVGDHVHVCHPQEAKSLLTELLAKESGPPPRDPVGVPSLEANVADRRDDTDDISAKIRANRAGDAVSQALRGAMAPATEARVQQPAAPTRKWPQPKGMPPSIEMRHPGELKVDDSYQRSIDTGPSRALIRRIANGWDWRMCMPLVVSKRDDGLYVIDGQHRQAAALLRGDIPFLPCCVGVYANVAEEAAMFVAINRARRAMNRLDDFHAAQAGADPDALAITAMVEAVGFTISRRTGSASWAPGEVAFTSAIGKIRRRSDEIARQALAMMAEAFPGQRLVAGASVFTATCSVLLDPPADFDRDRLLRALKTFDMAGWASFLSDSKGGTDRAKSLREMLLEAYADAGSPADVNSKLCVNGASVQ